MVVIFMKHGREICKGNAKAFKGKQLLELMKLGWTWKFQAQALSEN